MNGLRIGTNTNDFLPTTLSFWDNVNKRCVDMKGERLNEFSLVFIANIDGKMYHGHETVMVRVYPYTNMIMGIVDTTTVKKCALYSDSYEYAQSILNVLDALKKAIEE